jgi:adenylate cyclase 10
LKNALDITAKLNNQNVLENIKLSVKFGYASLLLILLSFGVGDINIIYVGGVLGRCEYLATGDPLVQAFHSEHHASGGGQIIISGEVHELVHPFFELTQYGDEPFYKVEGYKRDNNLDAIRSSKMKAKALRMKNKMQISDHLKGQILRFIPAALIPYIEIH